MAAGFEQSLQTRLGGGSGGNDPPETNLDYYAKPENYEGSNIHTISRFVYTSRKEEQAKHSTDKYNDNLALNRVFDRYKDICPNELTEESEEDDNHDVTDNSDNSNIVGNKAQYTALGLPYSQTMPEMSKRQQNKQQAPRDRKRSITAPPSDYQVKSSPGKHRRNSKYYINEDNQTLSDSGKRRNSVFHSNNEDSHNQSSDLQQYTESDSMDAERADKVSEFQRQISNLSLTSGVYRSATTSLSNITDKDLRLMMARQKFRHAIKLVLILLKWISTLTEKEDEDGKVIGGKTFTDIASEAFDEAGKVRASGIAFDVSQFKAKKEMSISNEVKHVLSIPTSLRSAEQLQTALFGLQHLKSFAEYPLHMQEKLCKVAWYQQVPHKKVIIRQGHFAENFYFILSGQAVVRILDKNPQTGEVSLRTAAVMRKGTSFGELALLHRSRRTATVVSQDMVQLLSIGREDFLDIFMSRSGPGEIPDHIKFIATLDFMHGWPIDQLAEHPECCLFHFFKRGVVIVKDSNQSDWLYVVKSGSCQVLKRLNGVRPQTLIKSNKSPRERDHNASLPRLDNMLTPTTSRIDTGRKKLGVKTTRIASSLRRAMEEYVELEQKDPSLTTNISDDTEESSPSNNNNTNTEKTTQRNSKSAVVRSQTSQSNHAFSTPGYSKSKFALFPKPRMTAKPHLASSRPTSVGSSAQSSTRKTQSAMTRRQSLDGNRGEEPDIGPVFVQVETLKPRDIFGLSSVHFDDAVEDPGTSVSLVSNGAECIMLSKKFFITHATELTKKMVRQSVHPYPSEESLQNNLQTKADWDVYKNHLVSETISNIHIFRNSHDKFVTLPDVGTYAM